MISNNIRKAIPAVEGKVISSAFLINDSSEAHGILLIFHDETELSISFDQQVRVEAEVLHYRWDDGEATMLDVS